MNAASRIQNWIWILIYIGMILLGLGISVRRSDVSLGWGIVVPGIALIAVGIVLIWVRSRMKDQPSEEKS